MLARLGKDVAIYGAADFAFRFVGFAVFPVYAHVFSVEQFGVFVLVTATMGVVALVGNLGLNNAAQRYYWDPLTEIAMQPTIVSTGLGVLAASSCLLVLALGAAAYPARELLASRYGISWTMLALALATVVPEQILQYCLDVLRLHFSPWRFSAVSFLKNLVGVGAGLVLVLGFGLGLEGLFAGALVGAAASVPVALVLVRRDLTLRVSAATARRLVSFGYPFIFAGLAFWLFGTVDRWMLAELSDATQLGLYAIAYKFASAIVFLNSAFGQAWSPMAHKIRREDAGYRAAYARVLSVWLFVLVLCGSTVALFGREVLQLLTPAEYWGAAPILAVLVMGVVVSGTTQVTAIGISIERQTRLMAWAAWLTTGFNIVLNLALIPLWGAAGAALATLFSYGLLTGLYLFWSQRLHPIPLEKSRLAFCAGLIAAVVAAAFLMRGAETSAPLVLAKLTLLAAMLGGAALLGIVDRSFFRALLRERLKA